MAEAQTNQQSSEKCRGRALSKRQAAIDARLDELIKDELPFTPYIFRIQHAEGRKLPQPTHSQHWRTGTPFAADEQELQYMTFRRPTDLLIRSHGQWDDGKGGIAPREVPGSHTSSGRTPLNGPSARKKITLADYKNRDKSKAVGKDIAPTQQAKIVESNTENGMTEGEKKDAEAKATEVKIVADNGRAEVNGNLPSRPNAVKRPAEDDNPSEKLTTEPSAAPPAKKPRLSAEEGPSQLSDRKPLPVKSPKPRSDKADSRPMLSISSKAPAIVSKKPDSKIHHAQQRARADNGKTSSQLPPMLSPTLPTVKNYQLPPLLSPTLPQGIEDLLAEAKAKRPKSNGSVTASSRAASSSVSSTRPRSDTATSMSQTSAGAPAKPSSPAPAKNTKHQGDKSVSSKAKIRSQDTREVKDQKPKLVVRLKIKKKQNRRELVQYLRLKPTPSKSHWKGSRRSEQLVRNMQSSNSPAPAPASSKNKRDRVEDEPELPRKRRKDSDPPVTQAQTPNLLVSSPLAPKSVSAQKSRSGAPTSNPASAAMRRGGSGQGSAATPAVQSRHGTPSIVDKESPSKQDLRVEFYAESERLVAIAIDLKHDSDKYLKLENASSGQLRLGVVIGTESVLCFVLANVVRDEPNRRQGQPGSNQQWKSILPLLRALTQRSKAYRHLNGLLYQIEGVVRDTIHHYELPNLRNVLREHEKEAPDQQEPALLKQYALFKESHDNDTQTSKAWREGQQNLWISEIQSAFPKTWGQARQRPSRGKGQEQDLVDLKNFAKDGFALPMGNLTCGLEAVNAGLSFLSELSEKEKVAWKPQLVL